MSHNEICTYTLPASLTIENAEATFQAFKELNLGSAVVTLDGAATHVITTPGAQLLLSLDRTVASLGGRLALVNPTTEFKEAFRLLGLESHLKKWTE